MAKGFGYRYEDGALRFSIKYGPTIAGVVVNNKWRRIIFRHQEGAAKAIKSLEKARMYEQFLEYKNDLMEVPDTYYISLYDVHLGPYIRDYVPSSGNVRYVSGDAVDAARYDGAVTGRHGHMPPIQPIPYTMAEHLEELERFSRGGTYTLTEATNAPRRRSGQWLRADWRGAYVDWHHGDEASVNPNRNIPLPEGYVEYPTDLAIENMRGTPQERERSQRQSNLLRQLDRIAGIINPRTRT